MASTAEGGEGAAPPAYEVATTGEGGMSTAEAPPPPFQGAMGAVATPMQPQPQYQPQPMMMQPQPQQMQYSQQPQYGYAPGMAMQPGVAPQQYYGQPMMQPSPYAQSQPGSVPGQMGYAQQHPQQYTQQPQMQVQTQPGVMQASPYGPTAYVSAANGSAYGNPNAERQKRQQKIAMIVICVIFLCIIIPIFSSLAAA